MLTAVEGMLFQIHSLNGWFSFLVEEEESVNEGNQT